jgi:hypothetical protein
VYVPAPLKRNSHDVQGSKIEGEGAKRARAQRDEQVEKGGKGLHKLTLVSCSGSLHSSGAGTGVVGTLHPITCSRLYIVREQETRTGVGKAFRLGPAVSGM